MRLACLVTFCYTMTMISRDAIKRYAKRLASEVKPLKIVLFGSYAYGQPQSDSDVDLLVIMSTRHRAVYEAARIQCAVPAPFPLDLLVRTPGQVRKRLVLGDSFMREITASGKVLYESAHA
ncbi:MAG: nucleotidyltransferase domain-containing protein [bacterium]